MRRLVRATLLLPGHPLVIEGPAEALELLRRRYLHSWTGAAEGPVDLELTVDGDRWHLRGGGRTTGPLTGALQAVQALEHEVESSLVARNRERIALHAGAIEAGGRAHLLAGPPDSGKSTSAFQLIELGHRLLSEEVTLVDPASLMVEPHLRTLALDARYLERYARERPIAHGRVERLDERWARYTPARARREPAPLATLILPRFHPGARSAVEELDASEVLPELLACCFAPAAAEEPFFDAVLGVLDGCRIVRATFSGTADALQLWRRLLPPAEP